MKCFCFLFLFCFVLFCFVLFLRERERESTHETVEVGTLVGVFTYKVGTKLRSGDMSGSPLQRWHLNALKHILVGLGG